MKTTMEENSGPASEHSATESWLEVVRRQVGSLNFGVVQIVVHGARVVQIERTEKVRLDKPIVVANLGD
ncbi:MAG TPA: YezD family protein [Verrucomicrobiae bacterium]|jgi:hypothetical protein|nr:YezD family protein [Verrucomicrobiae bacterium]